MHKVQLCCWLLLCRSQMSFHSSKRSFLQKMLEIISNLVLTINLVSPFFPEKWWFPFSGSPEVNHLAILLFLIASISLHSKGLQSQFPLPKSTQQLTCVPMESPKSIANYICLLLCYENIHLSNVWCKAWKCTFMPMKVQFIRLFLLMKVKNECEKPIVIIESNINK